MSGNLLVRFDEGRVGRTSVSPSLLLYREISRPVFSDSRHRRIASDRAAFLDQRYSTQIVTPLLA
jgi:hypothetical protein